MPTFGNTNIEATLQAFSNYINVFRFQMNAEDGTLDSISVYLSNTVASKLMKCALYTDAYGYTEETAERTIPVEAATWEVFSFSSPPSLSASVWYRLGIWASAGAGGAINFYHAATGGAHRWSANTYVSVDAWETPLVGTDTTRLASIYGTYTATPPPPSAGNATTHLGRDMTFTLRTPWSKRFPKFMPRLIV